MILAASISSMALGLYERKPKTSLSIALVLSLIGKGVFFRVIFVALGVMTGTLMKVNVGLVCFLALLLGASLQGLIILTMYQVLLTLEEYKMQAHAAKSFALMLTMKGVGSMVLTVLGDKIHYMNRDIQAWIYVSEGVIIGLMIIGYTFAMVMTRK